MIQGRRLSTGSRCTGFDHGMSGGVMGGQRRHGRMALAGVVVIGSGSCR